MKPPAFQFYADDFLAGVADMTQSEVGAYILLLCHQWNRGEIPNDPIRASLIAKGDVSTHVMSKFPSGKNERMEKVRTERNEWLAKQAESGRKGMAKRWGSKDNKPITSLYRVDNSPPPSPSPNKTDAVAIAPVHSRSFKKPTLDEVKLAMAKAGLPDIEAQKFLNYYESNGWKVGRNPMKSWTHAVGNWASNYRGRSFQGGGNQESTKSFKGMTDSEILREAL